MLNSNLTLEKYAGTDASFVLVQNLNKGTLRHRADTTANEPVQMRIEHTESGNGLGIIDRHLVSFIQTKIAASGPKKLTVNLTVAMPRDTTFAVADVQELVTYVIDFLSDFGLASSSPTMANLSSMLIGES